MTYASLGFFCFGEDLLDLKERLPLRLWHTKHVEQVAGHGHAGKYPEMGKTRLKEKRRHINMDVPNVQQVKEMGQEDFGFVRDNNH